LTAGFNAEHNAAVNVAFNQGLSPLFSSAASAGLKAAFNCAVSVAVNAGWIRDSSSPLGARPSPASNGAFSCAFGRSFTGALSPTFKAGASAELRRALTRAVLVRLPGKAAVCSDAQGPICSSRSRPHHNSAAHPTARRPLGEPQLPIQSKTDWTIESPVLFPVQCAVR
jgi:hypothetical protein